MSCDAIPGPMKLHPEAPDTNVGSMGQGNAIALANVVEARLLRRPGSPIRTA